MTEGPRDDDRQWAQMTHRLGPFIFSFVFFLFFFITNIYMYRSTTTTNDKRCRITTAGEDDEQWAQMMRRLEVFCSFLLTGLYMESIREECD